MVHLREVESFRYAQIASALGRSELAVRKKYYFRHKNRSSVETKSRRSYYSPEETAALVRVMEAKGSRQDYEKALPGRTWDSILKKRLTLPEVHDIQDFRRRAEQVDRSYRQAYQMEQQGIKRAEIKEFLGVTLARVGTMIKAGKRLAAAGPDQVQSSPHDGDGAHSVQPLQGSSLSSAAARDNSNISQK